MMVCDEGTDCGSFESSESYWKEINKLITSLGPASNSPSTPIQLPVTGGITHDYLLLPI